VAGELQAVIAPVEQKRIDKKPTTNLAAYEIYLKANAKREEYIKNSDQISLETAVNLYNTALEMDSTFARAYADLAIAYIQGLWKTHLEDSYLDTALAFADKALSYDDQCAEAYLGRALCQRDYGHFEEALANFNQALEINPNYAEAYSQMVTMLIRIVGDYQKGIEYCWKALSLIYGEDRSAILIWMFIAYQDIGMIDLAKGVLEEKLLLDGDSALWYGGMANLEWSNGNYVEAYRYARKAAAINKSDFVSMDNLICLPPDYGDEYYNNMLKYLEVLKNKNQSPPTNRLHRIGYGFFLAGNKEEAFRYFQMQIQEGEEAIRLKSISSQLGYAQYDLAATYAFIGEKEKAYYYLSEFDKSGIHQLNVVTLLKNDPLFNGIRKEPEFQRIQQSVEAKYQAEHERIRQWLEENDML
jgi:tetratricopeptide (TPR) repeat protein